MPIAQWSSPTPAELPLHALLPSKAPAFFFSGPTTTVLAHDEGTLVEGALRDRQALVDAAEAALRRPGANAPRLLVGAVPFAEDATARLFCPTRVSTSDVWQPQEDPPSPRRSAVHARPARPVAKVEDAHFLFAVRAAVDAIRRGELRKVVLSRTEDVQLEQPLDVARLLRVLRRQNPQGYVFALGLPRVGARAESTLLGVSPELLLSRRGSTVITSPLAGSVPRAADTAEDQERALELLRSPKDLHEHRLVVEQILEDLAPLTSTLRWERTPSAIATRTMWHLSTRIEGTLRNRELSSLRVALALHPTPAVCGTPARRASEWIRTLEPFDRGYFTGTLGHMDASGDGEWIVTIRCAEVSSTRVRLFAGAGIVESSEPEAELAETAAKMRTMLDVLGAGVSA